jgi:hypothetical protein
MLGKIWRNGKKRKGSEGGLFEGNTLESRWCHERDSNHGPISWERMSKVSQLELISCIWARTSFLRGNCGKAWRTRSHLFVSLINPQSLLRCGAHGNRGNGIILWRSGKDGGWVYHCSTEIGEFYVASRSTKWELTCCYTNLWLCSSLHPILT